MNMPKAKTYLVDSNKLNYKHLNPRFYEPNFVFVQEKLDQCTILNTFLESDPKGGTTPPSYLFKKKGNGIPYVKTSAISRDFINMNDLHYIHPDFHKQKLKRSITKPYDVIFTMTGKFMGKAALSPKLIPDLNMSQNSVVLRTENKYKSAYLSLFLNSEINKIQIKGLYTISKQKYLNQTKIKNLKIVPYDKKLIPILDKYIQGIDLYYEAHSNFKKAIKEINDYFGINEISLNTKKSFHQKANLLTSDILNPSYYRADYQDILNTIKSRAKSYNTLDNYITPKPGNEIGRKNYCSEGVPFIRISDVANFNLDYFPNYFCTEGLYYAQEQDNQFLDILMAKDGKIGETALITDSNKFVYASGLVKMQSGDIDTQLLLFTILSSMIGKIQLDMWTVIASTMAHLRSEFFNKCIIPQLEPELKSNILNYCYKGVEQRKKSKSLIKESKEEISNYFLSYS